MKNDPYDLIRNILFEKADTVIDLSNLFDISNFLDSETINQLDCIQDAIKLAFKIDGTVKMIEGIDTDYKGQKLSGLFFEINDVEKGKAYFSWYCKVE